MTKPHYVQFHCPNCKTYHTGETIFGRWLRNNPRLDSSLGNCFIDQDYWVHKFKTSEQGRDFQLIMCVEVKTLGGKLSDAQRDTLIAVNHIVRNRKQTPTKELRHQAGNGPVWIKSSKAGRRVWLRNYGVHVLRFSRLGPDDSESIWWDHNKISEDELTSILAFELDPDTLLPIDLRSHHKQGDLPLLCAEAEPNASD